MAHDTDLAERIRELLAAEPDISEKQMFGGLAFLVGGHLAVAASRQGGILARVDPADVPGLLESPGVEQAVMGKRRMRGWLRVDAEHLGTDAELATWVGRAAELAKALPARR